MPRLTDEQEEDDMDGTDWAQQHSHSVPEKYVDPTTSAVFPDSDLDEQGYDLARASIASAKRFRVGHRCQVCGIHLREKPHLLHIHHLDRDKTNSDDSNLQAACALCHAQSDGHEHLLRKIAPSDIAYLRDLRALQQKVSGK